MLILRTLWRRLMRRPTPSLTSRAGGHRPEVDARAGLARWAGSERMQVRALCLAPNAMLDAWRMYATRSAAAGSARHPVTRSRAEACNRGAGPRWCVSARLAILANRGRVQVALLPRVALSNVGRPGCD